MKGGLFILKETLQEQAYHKLQSPDSTDKTHVSFRYRDYVQSIQMILQTFYGARADWNQCIQQYYHSSEYQGQCHLPKNCEEIPLITTDDLRQMIAEDEQFHTRRDEFLALSKKIRKSIPHEDPQELLHAASLLGILPVQSSDSLYHRLILRDGMTAEEQQSIEAAIRSDPGRLASVISLFSSILIPGELLTFPLIGTAMTQPKSRYFYRGESAYYGSSRPSMYRFNNGIDRIKLMARWVTISEACYFLEQTQKIE